MDEIKENISEADHNESLIYNPIYEEIRRYYNSKGIDIKMQELFAADKMRFSKFSICLKTPFDGDILFDYSKNLLTSEALNLLLNLAKSKLVPEARDEMFLGEFVNFVEEKPISYIAFRNRSPVPMKLHGKNVMQDVLCQLQEIKKFYNAVISGVWRGFTGKQITDIVSIGEAGMILNSEMIVEALKPYCKGLNSHFICNIDGAKLFHTLKNINYERTLFFIISKDLEDSKYSDTLNNAMFVKNWLIEKTRNSLAIPRHFVMVCPLVNRTKVIQEFGVEFTSNNFYELWPCVDDQHSLWSPACLPAVFSIGYDNFELLLEGAHFMDIHFKTSPLNRNVPVILALISIWYTNFFDSETYAILPYGHCMHKFSAFIQQLEMESNGKYTTRYNGTVVYNTCPIVWGECASISKNSFTQMLHQGTRLIPCDFIAPVCTHRVISYGVHHKMLLGNFLSQSEALMLGKNAKQVRAELFTEADLIDKDEMVVDDLENEFKRKCGLVKKEIQNSENLEKIEKILKLIPHKVLPGNRPSNSILVLKYTPFILGSLIALYEHKTFVQSIIWDINAFDKHGITLGREMANNIMSEWDQIQPSETHDNSTNSLINFIKSTW